MSAPKPELDWSDDSIMDPINTDPFSLPEGELKPAPEPLPVIPNAASQAILAAVAQAQAAQQNVNATVGLVLATLNLSIDTHDIALEGGRAVVKAR